MQNPKAHAYTSYTGNSQFSVRSGGPFFLLERRSRVVRWELIIDISATGNARQKHMHLHIIRMSHDTHTHPFVLLTSASLLFYLENLELGEECSGDSNGRRLAASKRCTDACTMLAHEHVISCLTLRIDFNTDSTDEESNQCSGDFESIPTAVWFMIVTMTTVGLVWMKTETRMHALYSIITSDTMAAYECPSNALGWRGGSHDGIIDHIPRKVVGVNIPEATVPSA